MGTSNDDADNDLPKRLGGKAMPSGGSPTVRRRRAGKILRQMREQSGRDAQAAADALEVTTSTIYRMELGRVGIKPRDVMALTDVYAVTDAAQIEELVRLARDGRKRGWWARYSDTISPPYATYVGLEQDASSLYLYDGLIINGLLQTPDYARATFDFALEHSRRFMEERINLRMERQARLRDDLKIWNVIDEAAIRRVLGGPKVMIDQLQNLLELAALPNVHLQVLPFDGGAYPGMLSSFTILGFGEVDGEVDPGYRHPDVVYIEGHNGDVYEEGEDVAPFHEVFGNLRSAALGPGRSLEFIEQQANRLKAM